jgi:hypothetical protein
MTWTVSNDRSLIELRYVRDPGYFVTICSNGVLDHLEKLGKREVIVEHRVWGEWPWSTALYGFNPERVEGRTVLYCQDRHLVSGSRGSHTGRHPLERHLRRR